MREGHLTQRHAVIRPLIDLLREAVGASDDEDQTARTRYHHPLDIRGEGGTRELSPALIEEHYPIRRTGLAQDLRSLHLLLQLGGELAGAADVGDDLQGEGQVMAEAIGVELRQLFDRTAIGLAHSEEKKVHQL